ncbi:hypothetical protein TSUD_371010 [Trifolium subterraneum]|uniref:TF-B3 domain-containing protein n=1 Tax=Trifolium subterraneum TaxID=3900 RepID=A0A2Z6PLY0_TRISU|nr:hypothetical protein TSUD_371010 [Trifolium subterraneum]
MNFLPDVEDVKNIPEKPVINIVSSDNESDHHTEVLPNESSQQESEIDTEEDLEEENDGFKLHSWTKKVTKSMANLRKKQVLTFPNHISINVLANTDQVVILSDDTNFIYQCKIHTSTRSKDYGSYEKHIGDGWYAYMRRHRPRVDDLLEFNLTEPHFELNVKLEHR